MECRSHEHRPRGGHSRLAGRDRRRRHDGHDLRHAFQAAVRGVPGARIASAARALPRQRPGRGCAGKALPGLRSPPRASYSGPYVRVAVDGDTEITLRPAPTGRRSVAMRRFWIGSRCTTTRARVGRWWTRIAAAQWDSPSVSMSEICRDWRRILRPGSSVLPRRRARRWFSNGAALAARYGDDWQPIVRAIRLAIDKAAIVKGPLDGAVARADTLVSPLAWYALPPPTPCRLEPRRGPQAP